MWAFGTPDEGLTVDAVISLRTDLAEKDREELRGTLKDIRELETTSEDDDR